MASETQRFGIYLNPEQLKVVRITSPYWLPPEPEWAYVTKEVNATLLEIRRMIADQGLSDDHDSVVWGRIPLLD